MRKALESDLPAVLSYLKNDVGQCLYMYIDIDTYRLSNPAMGVWLDTDDAGNVTLVVMKYHTSISLYTAGSDYDRQAVCDLLKEHEIYSITGQRRLIEPLQELLKGEYGVEYGYIYKYVSLPSVETDNPPEWAVAEECDEIAALICSDEGIGSYYVPADLAAQLRERMATGMGRSLVVRENGVIVGHIATYAEHGDIAITGGQIVKKDCRNGFTGVILEDHIVKALDAGGFTSYAFVTDRKRKRFLDMYGNECVGEYGKLMRRA